MNPACMNSLSCEPDFSAKCKKERLNREQFSRLSVYEIFRESGGLNGNNQPSVTTAVVSTVSVTSSAAAVVSAFFS